MNALKLLIDCNALCYRSFYGLPGDLKFGSHDTNIIYGFMNQIQKLAGQFKTNRFIFCWDSPRSYRALVYPEYKANRLDKLTDIQKENLKVAKEQFVELEEVVLPNLGFDSVFSQNGYEADDLIAYLALRLPDNYMIISGDADLLQLLYDDQKYTRCEIYNGKIVTTLSDWRLGTGLKDPFDWIKVKAIAGCSTDNIAGVDGAGELKAIQYLLGTLPNGKIKTRIEESKEIIQRNIGLVCLPYSGGVKEISCIDKYPKQDTLYAIRWMEIFREYGLGSFLGDNFEKWRTLFDLQPGSPKRGDNGR